MEVCYASSGQPRGGASCPPRRRSPLPLRRSPSSRRPALPRRDPFPASTLSAPPRSLCTVFTITRQGYGSRVAFTAGIWSARLGGTRGRRSASPETVTGPTETPASCRSVAGASFANSGFVARTRFGVFGQAMSRHASRTLRRGLLRRGVWALRPRPRAHRPWPCSQEATSRPATPGRQKRRPGRSGAWQAGCWSPGSGPAAGPGVRR
jgi:hypothetical protein